MDKGGVIVFSRRGSWVLALRGEVDNFKNDFCCFTPPELKAGDIGGEGK